MWYRRNWPTPDGKIVNVTHQQFLHIGMEAKDDNHLVWSAMGPAFRQINSVSNALDAAVGRGIFE